MRLFVSSNTQVLLVTWASEPHMKYELVELFAGEGNVGKVWRLGFLSSCETCPGKLAAVSRSMTWSTLMEWTSFLAEALRPVLSSWGAELACLGVPCTWF